MNKENTWGPRGQFDLVGHNRFDPYDERIFTEPINNVVVDDGNQQSWHYLLTSQIGDWRADFRSCYIRWSVALNGLHIAASKYSDPIWQKNNAFVVRSLDVSGSVEVAKWRGPQAAEAHLAAAPMLIAFGIVDLFACLEEIIFKAIRIFLWSDPTQIIRGEEFRELRRLRGQAANSKEKREEWESQLQERIDNWHRKKLYDGLESAYLAFCSWAKLSGQAPPSNDQPEVWAKIIRTIAVLRNCLIHGATIVPKELADLSQSKVSPVIPRNEGDKLSVYLPDLQAIQFKGERLLTSLNVMVVRAFTDGI